ncbi:ATP-binding cassette domain-containing protein [uncultured Limosilactobacillus sp.]|uniref:methionine ABC transporter ATP-binding protein n=1 Tax=uncultured Limosilactobacillus sp. TaxID=2837629 RepID=UPI0025E7011E|nr:ATP-binding cassette domain-containing protein [uncultured Limosilactobacillus sp.]
MIDFKDVSVTFHDSGKEVRAVKNVSLTIEDQDIYGIVGYSGAGKSTLVRTINLLQEPTGGHVLVNGTDFTKLSEKELRQHRRKIGMIFQHFNLLESLTIFDNVAFPLRHTGKSKQEIRKKVRELLALVGLADKEKVYPSQLSGGQKQRVAIARALANDPQILLSDEATSALDPKTTLQILRLLKKLNKQLGLTIVLITHQMEAVKAVCNKVAVMEYGRVIEQGSAAQIFSEPQEKLTQEFIRVASHVDEALTTLRQSDRFHLGNDEQLLQLTYNGTNTDQPLIASLFSNFGVVANILYGNVDLIQDVPLGNLIISLRGDSTKRQASIDYLKKQGVHVTELSLSTSDHQLEGE